MAIDNLKMEPLEVSRVARQTEAQQKCSTLGERKIKTQGSMMELMEMKRKAIRSRLDSLGSVMELMYTRICEMDREREDKEHGKCVLN